MFDYFVGLALKGLSLCVMWFFRFFDIQYRRIVQKLPSYRETTQLICSASQLTSFYIMVILAFNKLSTKAVFMFKSHVDFVLIFLCRLTRDHYVEMDWGEVILFSRQFYYCCLVDRH